MTKLVRRQQTTIIKLGRTDDEVGAPATNRYLQNLEGLMTKLVRRQQTTIMKLGRTDDEVGALATNHYHKTWKD